MCVCVSVCERVCVCVSVCVCVCVWVWVCILKQKCVQCAHMLVYVKLLFLSYSFKFSYLPHPNAYNTNYTLPTLIKVAAFLFQYVGLGL